MMYQNSSGSKAQLLQKINEVSFAVNDILLYLDTHPCCEKGMALYREYAAERKKRERQLETAGITGANRPNERHNANC